MVLAYLDVWQAARIVQNKTKHLEKHLGSTMYSDDDAVWIELDIYIYTGTRKQIGEWLVDTKSLGKFLRLTAWHYLWLFKGFLGVLSVTC